MTIDWNEVDLVAVFGGSLLGFAGVMALLIGWLAL
jgi:hypothetical protein